MNVVWYNTLYFDITLMPNGMIKRIMTNVFNYGFHILHTDVGTLFKTTFYINHIL